MGWHGWSKVDCVTVWLTGANWNCTMSPTAAVMLLGEYASVPFALPTLTTWTVTPLAVEAAAEVVVVAARAEPMLKAERAKVENCILTVQRP